ncbi:MAG: gamma-glutamyltransferase, partial [Bacteroidota bacterium]
MGKTRGLIAAGHSATAEAAASILREGGNAFDAAVAALLASFIAEPCMSSAGGGAFMTAFKQDGTALMYDFFVQTPMRKRPADEVEFFGVDLDFGTTTERFYIGMGSVGVPGTIAGCFRMAEELGSLPMKELAVPAIELAKNGLPIDAFQFHDFELLEPILAVSKPDPVFWDGDRLRKTGEIMANPDLGDCLEHLVREGVQDFYLGDVAKLILKLNDQRGGHLSAEDMSQYAIQQSAPLIFPYRDRTILTNPLPGLGGAIIALALAKLEAAGPVRYEAAGK